MSNSAELARLSKWTVVAAAISSLIAVILFCFWWAAPLVPGPEGIERAPIPAGLALFTAVSVLMWWNALALTTLRLSGGATRGALFWAAEFVATAPVLLSVALVIFSNEIVGVWLFIILGFAGFVGGLILVAAAAPPSAPGSKISEYLNSEEIADTKRARSRILIACGIVLVAAACAIVWFGIPSLDSGAHKAGPTRVFKSGNFVNIDGEFRDTGKRSPLGGVGGCIALSGADRSSVAAKSIDCSDQQAAYRIFQLADDPSECAVDSDQRYAPRKTDEGPLILCLDYNWAKGLCIFPGDTSTRVHAIRDVCGRGGERPTEILYDVGNAQQCPTGGYPHPARRFTVCSEKLK
ncbi:hypothetical protein [Mycobacteroides franklinii]|uniref:LppU/SCO3897 family protein n=1 Tax=Mycobacteroides franklinii TaxID=948102 RepID=UPI0012FF68B1|nr:hypothetical protein [Mycobacteroides franklinii]